MAVDKDGAFLTQRAHGYDAPPFFRREPAPLVKFCFYAVLSLALILVDTRFQTLGYLRTGVALLAYPFQQVALFPLSLYRSVSVYFSGISGVQEENARLRRAQLEDAARLLRAAQLEAENTRLRQLLDMKTMNHDRGRISRILYAASAPFSRRLIVDRGSLDRISRGQAVIDYSGVVGQITRVFPHASEVMLVTDENHAVPVYVPRNGLRSVLFGLGNGQLELHFVPIDADIQNGDQLVTSGLDGTFPVGLPVARVIRVERDASYAFARIYCAPLAGIETFGELMILDPKESVDLPQDLSSGADDKPGNRRKRFAKK